MEFEEIYALARDGGDLPARATLTEQCAYHSIKGIATQLKTRRISKEMATRDKKHVERRFREQRRMDELRREGMETQAANIRRTAELRARLCQASREGDISKELWLEAVECVCRLCGDEGSWRSCEKYLEEIGNGE